MQNKYVGVSMLMAVLLAGCGGGGSDSSAPYTPPVVTPPVVTPPVTNTAPVANAGAAQSVTIGTTVTLDGTTSTDANNDPLVYAWVFTAVPTGSTAVLSSSTSPKPTFVADKAGTYTAKLTVSDGKSSSIAATVSVTAAVANAAPIANAGAAQSVVVNKTVYINGDASTDANGDPLKYTWTLVKPTGSAAVLFGVVTNSMGPGTSFTPDVPGNYVVTLTVNDGKVNSAPTTVTVTATAANAAPVPKAGAAQNVAVGAKVTLDGTGSTDAENDTLTYGWGLITKPTGSTAVLADANTSKPTFIADVEGIYVATLGVGDGKVHDAPRIDGIIVIPSSQVTITAVAPKYLNQPYLARNGLTVTLKSFTAVDRGNGYVDYTATYTQENKTTVAIDEGQMKLYFAGSGTVAMSQYGFFGKVYPGAASAVTRSYTFTAQISGTIVPSILEFDHDNFFASAPVTGSLQWKLPVSAKP